MTGSAPAHVEMDRARKVCRWGIPTFEVVVFGKAAAGAATGLGRSAVVLLHQAGSAMRKMGRASSLGSSSSAPLTIARGNSLWAAWRRERWDEGTCKRGQRNPNSAPPHPSRFLSLPGLIAGSRVEVVPAPFARYAVGSWIPLSGAVPPVGMGISKRRIVQRRRGALDRSWRWWWQHGRGQTERQAARAAAAAAAVRKGANDCRRRTGRLLRRNCRCSQSVYLQSRVARRIGGSKQEQARIDSTRMSTTAH